METSVNPFYLGAFIVYLSLLMVIASWAYRRTTNVMEFWVFGQKMGPQLATWSLVANFVSAVSVIGFTGAVFAGGYSIMTHTVLGLMLGLSALYFVAAKVRTLNVLTFPDLIARVSGFESARPIAGAVLLLNGLLYLIMQLVGAGLLVTAITGVSYQYMVWIIGIVFILYTVLGGMVSVAWTDLVQGILMVGALAIVLIYMLIDQGGLTSVNEKLAAIDSSFVHPTGEGEYTFIFIGATFLAFFGTLLTEQDMLIRIAATKDVKTAKTHIALAGVILSVFYSLLIILGGATTIALGEAGIVIDTPDAAFPTLITQYVPTGVGVLIVLGVMSAILSTTDTRLHAIGMTAARDIYSYFRPQAGEREMMRVSRTVTVALGCMATAVAYDPPGTIITLYGFRAVVLTSAFLVPVYLAAYWAGLEGRAVLIGIVGGAVIGLGSQIMGGGVGPIPSTFAGVGAAVLTLLGAHLYYKAKGDRVIPAIHS